MKRLPVLWCAAAVLAWSGVASAAPAAPARPVPAAMPVADHHQYVYSPAAAAFMSATSAMHPVSAQDLIPQLDAAGIERAAVLSVAYVYGQPARSLAEEYARVRAENDWAARQAAEYPERLVALCSVDPLRDYALAELARCAASPEFGRGIKLQPASGGALLDDPQQVERLRRVFRSANARGMAIVLQLQETGVREARLLLEQLLPHAPDVPVQVAYTGDKPGARGASPQLAALAVLADAAARRDPRMRHVWVDVTAFARPGLTAADARRLVRRLRQVGMERVLYGSDTEIGMDVRPREAWAAFRSLPLTDAEAARVANNVMSYLR
ncbi:amidohydrolase family protein [Massilia sp. LC238]|uniref:amidohydrolase family protein n=1 Tax=Massilia sp. LC238 TaxID=1502852 RepID=UPI0004E3E9F9|nr:amidohydrolase family protein [Massilia sp. LC238]KFC75832.1 putative metal-dependent hydrolase of the TIM-barrel fold protein [Massilia sp. LC238]